MVGWNGSAGTATHYGLGGQIESAGGVRFFATIQTGPGPPSLLYNRYRVFPGVKQLGCAIDHPLPSSAEVNETVDLYLYSLLELSWPVRR
jgi:hypothetical protein